ncbi:hypothetical protein MMC22_002525 [Lobaria immixta]|nr:hypothetical protein [Lobaria immixta]
MAKVASPDPSKPEVNDEVDDYMSMAIVEPAQPRQKETYTQRRIRKQREAERKSCHEVEPSASLSTAIPTTSKGFQMLSKLGYTPGSTLGAAGNKNAMLEPVMVEMKEDRGGVGLANEKKRKLREAFEGMERGDKAEESGFRERVAKEREEKRTEGQVVGAMKVLERLEEETEDGAAEKGKKKKVNVLYRGLVRQRQERERERRAQYDLHQSLSRNPAYEEDEEDGRLAWGGEEEDVEEEDEELEAFEKLEPRRKLEQLVEELRNKYWYCFWCKHRYGDESMEGCPGVEEDDHD